MSTPTPTVSRRVRLLERLKHFAKGPNPLHPRNWEGRLSAVTFRRFQIGDLPRCLELYKQNEPGRFPEGVISQYEKALREQSSYFLVAEREGRVVATGGMAYVQQPHIAVFCFGLVSPGNQGTGIGTALLLVRFALLKKDRPLYRVLILAVAKSFGFYQRFGFQPCGSWPDPNGQEHPAGSLVITYEEAQQCRQLLADHGISVPHDEEQVPFRKKEEESSAAD
jgi:N-acetylglutamate synthase-like GNAT family acetyltransferase